MEKSTISQKNRHFKQPTIKYLYLTLGFILIILSINSVSAVTCFATGGNLTIVGSTCIHTFLINGTFNTTQLISNATVLVVAGGGGGGHDSVGADGGGGAGGLIYNTTYTINGNYNVIVGLGGISAVDGTNSSFDIFNAKGGGTGGHYNNVGGNNGGSGGGGGQTSGTGGAGFAGQGNNGGGGASSAGGGGGGFASVGVTAGSCAGGNGGNATLININGTNVYYAGGGGAGTGCGIAGGVGGNLIGGKGAGASIAATDGLNGTGSGGGGCTDNLGGKAGNGGSGIVIISYIGSNTTTDFTINSEVYNLTSFETENQNFILNITYDSVSFTLGNSYLVYNGILYPAQVNGTGNSLITTSIDVPVNSSSYPFYWQITLTNSTNTYVETTPPHSQTVNPIYFVLCNSTINKQYINYTFEDEETSIATTAALTSSFNYYIGSGTVSKTYTFQNTTGNVGYNFCFSPSNKTIYVTPSLQYSNSNSTIRTSNALFPLTLTNSTTSVILYLLKTTDGIYSSYQVVNTVQVPISNALVTVVLNGNTIESKTTDSSGLATFFLNPNIAYAITASKSGYASTTVSVTPTQSTYTITLNSNSVTNTTYYNQGINISIAPGSQFLNASTGYNFQVNFTDNLYNVTNWGFNITDGNSTIRTSGNLPQSTTTYTVSANTGIAKSLSLTVFWNINGTINQITKSYTIEGLTGSGFSIYNGIIDLKSYLNNGGIFGLDGASMNILIFIIIMVVTGVSAYRFGLSSPAILAGIITIQVFLFDVVFGLIYYDPGFFPSKVPHIATVFMGITLIALIIREGTSY